MAIITISRQFGCEGDLIGEKIAEILGYQFINHDIIKIVSILTSTPSSIVRSFDEEFHSNATAILSKYIDINLLINIIRNESDLTLQPVQDSEQTTKEKSIFDEKVRFDPIFDSDSFQKIVTRVIIKLADRGNVVIMGRGAQCILKDHPNALHLKLYAPLEKRIEYVAKIENITHKAARKKVEEVDERKKNFLKHYYNENIDDPELYHLLLNLGRFSLEQTTDIIVNIVKTYFQ